MKLKRYRKEHTWLKAREGYITSSDIPVLLGIGYGGVDSLHLYYDKRGELVGTPKTNSYNMEVRFAVGHALEPLIAGLSERHLGVKTVDPGKYCIASSDHLGFNAGVTVDRFIVERNTPLDIKIPAAGILEEKTVISQMRHKWKSGPDMYALSQLLYQMAVCEMDYGAVAALIGLDTFTLYEVDLQRYGDLQDQILDTAWAFAKRLKEGNPPPARHTSIPALKLRYPESTRTTIMLSGDDWQETADKYRELREERKDCKKALALVETEVKDIEAKIMESMGENEALDAEVLTAKWQTKDKKEFTVAASRGRKLYVRLTDKKEL